MFEIVIKVFFLESSARNVRPFVVLLMNILDSLVFVNESVTTRSNQVFTRVGIETAQSVIIASDNLDGKDGYSRAIAKHSFSSGFAVAIFRASFH